jgi:hypothetical protein
MAVSRVNFREQTDMSETEEQSDTAATDGWSTPDQTAYAESFGNMRLNVVRYPLRYTVKGNDLNFSPSSQYVIKGIMQTN